MKKIFKIGLVFFVLISAYLFNNVVIIKHYNSNSLYGSFVQKVNRATEIREQEKYIIIGGSASNLGFDSKVFEKLSGKPAINLAVSAGVPLRVYLKMAEDCAREGDTIIMPLEYAYYSTSFYIIDESYVDVVSIFPDLKCEDTLYGNIEYYYTDFLRSFTRLNDCFMFMLKDALNVDNTIYIADSVNEYGDFYLHQSRESTYKRTIQDVSFTYDKNTLEELNKYIIRMKEKGINVFVTFPVYDLYSVLDHEAFSADIEKVLREHLPEECIIGTPHVFAYDEDFYFDTAYHIKYENRAVYTKDLFECLP